MKKCYLALVAVLAINFTALAGNADLFSYDEAELNSSMVELNELEDFVNANAGVTYADIAASNSQLVENISDQPSISITDAKRNRVLGIPSWIWGCVFGVAGLAVVYFVAEDKEETKEALWGCVASTVLGIVFYFVAWGAIFAGAAAA